MQDARRLPRRKYLTSRSVSNYGGRDEAIQERCLLFEEKMEEGIRYRPLNFQNAKLVVIGVATLTNSREYRIQTGYFILLEDGKAPRTSSSYPEKVVTSNEVRSCRRTGRISIGIKCNNCETGNAQ